MSRAFVKEDGEVSSFRDDEQHSRKTVEWLKIQEKKLDFLLHDPKGQAIEASKRNRWIDEAKSSIEIARSELGLQ